MYSRIEVAMYLEAVRQEAFFKGVNESRNTILKIVLCVKEFSSVKLICLTTCGNLFIALRSIFGTILICFSLE